jgi:MSHA biogenesis protein MshG
MAVTQTFAWRGRGADGDVVTGVIDAADDAAVAEQLLSSGVTPVTITAQAARTAPGRSAL